MASKCCRPSSLDGGVAQGGTCEGAEELVFGAFEHAGRLRQQALRMMRGLEGRCVVAREEASLQLADPVPTLDSLDVGLRRKMVLDPALVELLVVERAELGCQPAQAPNERRLGVDGIGVVAEAARSAEGQADFGLAFYFGQRVARQQQIREQNVAARQRQVGDRQCYWRLRRF